MPEARNKHIPCAGDRSVECADKVYRADAVRYCGSHVGRINTDHAHPLDTAGLCLPDGRDRAQRMSDKDDAILAMRAGIGHEATFLRPTSNLDDHTVDAKFLAN